MSESIRQLHALGQSLWYDNIERGMLQGGEMAAMIARGDIRGVTSNPSIFQKAIANSSAYDDELERHSQMALSAEQIYERLAIADIQAAADLFRELYDRTRGADGYVSLEVNPHLAADTEGTIDEAKRLWQEVDRPNLMVKIPATPAGLPAIADCIAAGLNINVTLIFSLARYAQVMAAYLEGLIARQEAGEPLGHVASVASFFVSRVDTKADRLLEGIVRSEGPYADLAAGLMGKLAVANARLAYQQYQEVVGSEAFAALESAGARRQRPLWASTSTKNPRYSDVKYVEQLIGPETVNTVPGETLEAFRDHGEARVTLDQDLAAAHAALESLGETGISMERITKELEEEGVKAFAESYDGLLQTIASRTASVTR